MGQTSLPGPLFRRTNWRALTVLQWRTSTKGRLWECKKTPAGKRTKRKLPKSRILRAPLAGAFLLIRSGSCRRIGFSGRDSAASLLIRSQSCRSIGFCGGTQRPGCMPHPPRGVPPSGRARGASLARPSFTSSACGKTLKRDGRIGAILRVLRKFPPARLRSGSAMEHLNAYDRSSFVLLARTRNGNTEGARMTRIQREMAPALAPRRYPGAARLSVAAGVSMG